MGQNAVDYALRKHMEWYLGDGVYGDGPEFHFDYYNSYVIQPMLVDILDAVGDESGDWAAMREPVRRRAARYASILERLINRDGSYPVMGRSSAYRFGAFQSLAQAALNKELELPTAQVRCALTAVIGKVMSYPDVFDGDGWLNIGVCGEQPSLGEYYISTAAFIYAAPCSCRSVCLGAMNSGAAAIGRGQLEEFGAARTCRRIIRYDIRKWEA